MKERSYKTIKAELDRVFARFIKIRDSKDGYFTCICCNKPKLIDEGQASHYHSRRYLSIRWNEKNVNFGCTYCNYYLKGNIPNYTKGLIAKYGKSVFQELEIKKHQTVKYARFDLEMMIIYYKDEILQLTHTDNA